MKGLSNGTLKTFSFIFAFSWRCFCLKSPLSKLVCLLQSNSKLSYRETVIGLIMFAVIMHLNGTHHNVRLESQ